MECPSSLFRIAVCIHRCIVMNAKAAAPMPHIAPCRHALPLLPTFARSPLSAPILLPRLWPRPARPLPSRRPLFPLPIPRPSPPRPRRVGGLGEGLAIDGVGVLRWGAGSEGGGGGGAWEGWWGTKGLDPEVGGIGFGGLWVRLGTDAGFESGEGGPGETAAS